jgi:hypothetical protein
MLRKARFKKQPAIILAILCVAVGVYVVSLSHAATETNPQTTWATCTNGGVYSPLGDSAAAALVTHQPEVRPFNASSYKITGVTYPAPNYYVPNSTELQAFLSAKNSNNQTPVQANPYYQYVDGLDGLTNPSTDDLVQWAAHKWGIPEDWLRAQYVQETSWNQFGLGDQATETSSDYAQYPVQARVAGSSTDVFESMGISQIKWRPNGTVGAGSEPLRWKSTAFNMDVQAANVRFYYDDPNSLRTAWGDPSYVRCQQWNSVGAWFEPYPWNNSGQQTYASQVQTHLNNRDWTTTSFINQVFTFPAAITFNSGSANYYVSPSGSDSNSGTSPSSAWKTIAKVNSVALSPGQSVAFEGGQTFSGTLNGNGSGSSGNPTVYTSYGTGKAILSGAPSVYPTAVSYVSFQNLILDGGSSNNGNGCVQDFSGGAATNITFDSDEIRNCSYGINQGRAADTSWTISNCYIHDINESGIVIGGPSHTANAGGFIIQNNQIEHTGTDDPNVIGSNAHGIYDQSKGAQILNNDIGDFQTEGVSVRFGGNLIEGNTIHDSHRPGGGDAGIAYWSEDAAIAPGGSTTTVRYNRIWNVEYGVNLAGDNSYGGNKGPENWRIYNNTFSAGTGGTSGVIGNGVLIQSTMGDTEIAIQNDVFTGFSGGGISRGYTPTTYTENHNDWYNTGSPGGAGDKTVNSNLTAVPNFVPNTGSPVIDAGTTSVAGAVFASTCNGSSLSYCAAAPDMGAVENGSGSGGGVVGDLNGDGHVTIVDLSILLSHWQSTTTPAYDLNNNGTVDIFDLSILLSHYGT